MCRAAHQGLFQPAHLRMVIVRYVRPHYIPLLPPHCHNRTYHIQAVLLHHLNLTYLLLLPHDGDVAPVPALRLCLPYRVAGPLPRVDPLYQLRIQEDSYPQIAMM